jgi:hypothetical protein
MPPGQYRTLARRWKPSTHGQPTAPDSNARQSESLREQNPHGPEHVNVNPDSEGHQRGRMPLQTISSKLTLLLDSPATNGTTRSSMLLMPLQHQISAQLDKFLRPVNQSEHLTGR